MPPAAGIIIYAGLPEVRVGKIFLRRYIMKNDNNGGIPQE